MWERTLQDLIRGIRANSSKPQAQFDVFLQEAIEEIRKELKGGDMELKAKAVLKMVYLMMLYPVTPPPSFPFHVVEVMSSSKYAIKEVGYLAAEGAFPEGTEEIVLTVNGLKKDLLSPHAALPQLALHGLATLLNPTLARDVSHDISSLLTHSKPQVRKRAVLCLYKVFEMYPDSLQDNFQRLRDRLSDEDQSVVSATVNVLTELARKNAKNYLPLAPELFEVLSKSENNWMLIKVVKLFALLTPHEPRLVRKLLPPLTNLITTTSAISLLYECVLTCITGGMLDDSEAGEALARVCVGKLSGFLKNKDQNLKYIALLALVHIVPTHPHLIEDYQEIILSSVDDADLSIRLRALDLVCAMATRRNAQPIIDQLLSALLPSTKSTPDLPSASSALLSNLSSTSTGPSLQPSSQTNLLMPSYRLELTNRILLVGSKDTYSSIPDFSWYLSVLIDLGYISRVDVGKEIRRQLVDIVGRVRDSRRKAVELLEGVLSDPKFLKGAGDGLESGFHEGGEAGWEEIVAAGAWICGEYNEYLSSPPQLCLVLLSPLIARLSPETISVCIHASAKIFASWAAEKAEMWDVSESSTDLKQVKEIVTKLVNGLNRFKQSEEAEVQERTVNIINLFAFVQANLDSYEPPASVTSIQSSIAPEEEGFTAHDSSLVPTLSSPANAPITPAYPKSLLLLSPLFTAYALPPVSTRAQSSIIPPAGLDLDTPLYERVPESTVEHSSDDEGDDDSHLDIGKPRNLLSEGRSLSDTGRFRTEEEEKLRRVVAATVSTGRKKKVKGKSKLIGEKDESKEERKKRKAARLARQGTDSYRLKENHDSDDIDSIPVVKLDLGDVSKPTTGRKKPERPVSPPVPEIDRDGEMPEGFEPTSTSSSLALSALPVKISERDESVQKDSLKDVVLNLDSSEASSSALPKVKTRGGAYEEYVEGDKDLPNVKSIATVDQDVQKQPVPLSGPAVEVVKVVKKKKAKQDGTATPSLQDSSQLLASSPAEPGLKKSSKPKKKKSSSAQHYYHLADVRMIIDTEEILSATLQWVQSSSAYAFPLVLVFLGYLFTRRYLVRPVASFDVQFPPESDPSWKGTRIANPSLQSHLSDPTLHPEEVFSTCDQATKYVTCFDPSTNYHLATISSDTSASIDAKVRAADNAQKAWAQTTLDDRRVVMRSLLAWLVDEKNMERIVRVGVRDTGKTLLDAAFGEILTTCSKLEWMIKHGETYIKPEQRPGNMLLMHKVSRVYYEPLGTVAACVSWNYPFHNALSPIISSLFTGNSVIIKCSEQVAWSSTFYINSVKKCLEACGHSPDLVQLVVCYPEEASALTEHALIRHITFIGSEQVGRIVASSAAKNLTPCIMELGGKDPAILLPSADVSFFSSTFLRSVFQGSGQGCIASERFIVHRSLLPKLIPDMERRIQALVQGSSLGDNSESATVDFGSMISDARFDQLERMIREAVEDGAKLLIGGKRSEGLSGNGFFQPTLLVDVKPGMAVAKEEVFAPIMTIIPYDDVAEAVEIANSSRYGLGASVYGRSKRMARDVARQLECGMVALNDFGTFYINQSQPFGGCKASGYGRFGGPEGLRGLCNIKAVIEDRFFGIIQTPIPGPVDYPANSVKSWTFVSGLVRLFYAPSWRGLLGGVRDIIRGSI
ncbi:Vacuolar H-ATPase V1 sector, subunit G [Phaffia rhodozyma]|uniref:Vacuolar H-ATPase V1 sector, subunit G n=1 Tax=Phaffia rhodozyma TaxID=264483 RepID=A0A0F7SKK5_PHARH|nr:Vacuolar H-ATPase V1 sector, subunit G [Phaffia rhodozyma]